MYLNFLSKIFSQSAEKFRRGSLVCFRESLVSKSLYMRGGKGVSRFSVPIYKLKNVKVGIRTLPTNSKRCCPTNYAMVTIVISDKCQKVKKKFGTTETRNRTYCLRTLLFWPTAVIYLRKK